MKLISIKSLVIMFLMLISFVAFGEGLLSAVTQALGVKGDVGEAIHTLDSFSSQLGGEPGKAAFGGAIADWSDTNNKSIDKLGETNDRTVAKFLSSIDRSNLAFQSGNKENINLFSDELNNSISNLDESLSKNIDRLNNSLTDQTLRLDTVFQKQISTFFLIGRIILTVIIFGGLTFTVLQIILGASDINSVRELFKQKKSISILALAVSIIALLITWKAPEPKNLESLEDKYNKAYQRSLQLEDFSYSQNNASQLTVLKPESDIYRSWNLKSEVFRDLVLRPTMLLSQDQLFTLYVKLGQATAYRYDAKLGNDPDIITAHALIDAITAKSELDYAKAAIFFQDAIEVKKKKENDQSIEHLDEIAKEFLYRIQSISFPYEMLDEALTESNEIQVKKIPEKEALLRLYKKFINTIPKSPSEENTSPNLTIYLSSFSEFSETLRQKLIVKKFYQELTAKYYAYLQSLSSPPIQKGQDLVKDSNKIFCDLEVYYQKFLLENYQTNNQNIAFISKLFTGPFTILERVQKLSNLTSTPTITACSAISNEDIIKQSNFVDTWLPNIKSSKIVKDGKAMKFLKDLILTNQQNQNTALTDYEKLFTSSKNLFDYNIDLVQDPLDRKARANAIFELAKFSSVLGIYIEDNKKIVPAAFYIKHKYQTSTEVTERQWNNIFVEFLSMNSLYN